MVLIKFRDRDFAEEFAQGFNGRPFGPTEVCALLSVMTHTDPMDDAAGNLPRCTNNLGAHRSFG